MKISKLALLIILSIVILYSCKDDLSLRPHNGKTFQDATNTLDGLKKATAGVYALVKGTGYRTNTTKYMYIGVNGGDNVMMAITTPNPWQLAFNYKRNKNQSDIRAIWQHYYKIIYSANQNIAATEKLIKNGNTPSKNVATLKELKGENLFLRAKTYFDLVRLFGRPYIQNPSENMGVPIVTNPNTDSKKPRATVKAVYDQIVKDLTEASKLMTKNKSNSYASNQVAQAMLSRVYLYMGENKNVVTSSNQVIQSGRYKFLSTDQYANMYKMGNESNSEDIYVLHHQKNDVHGSHSFPSAYFTSPKGAGYGQVFASESIRDLFNVHPNDVRSTFIQAEYITNENGDTTDIAQYNGYEVYYMTKCTYQDGIALLCSPIYIRYAEMFLNRAEAYAKMGIKSKAIKDVNKIRKRAGLQDSAMYKASTMSQKQVLSAVLKERRMEFYEEGNRQWDIFRNNRKLKRDYASVIAGHIIIQPDDYRIVYPIPYNAILRNPKLQQNPGYGGK